MKDVLRSNTHKTIHGVDMVAMFLEYMLHVNHTNYNKMVEAEHLIMPLGCRAMNNSVDCGMRHMETYKGDGNCCGLSKEGNDHINELIDLRRKYATKILLANCNQVKKEFERETQAISTRKESLGSSCIQHDQGTCEAHDEVISCFTCFDLNEHHVVCIFRILLFYGLFLR